MKQKILLIEEDDGSRLGIVRSLSQKGYAVSVANNLANAEEDVLARRYDAVILGINLADGKATAFIKGIRAYYPYLPIVVITGGAEIEIAVDAVRCGADNVLAKPLDLAALGAFLKILLEDDPRVLPEPVSRHPGKMNAENFFGTCPAARLFPDLTGAAAANAPVLITGETGTGKGLLARWIQQNGARSDRPFAGVNCSGLRGDLLKAELFGARSRTGIGHARSEPGLLEKAADGTLFLDEIGDMDLAVQGALLAVLQDPTPRSPGAGQAAGTGFHLICTSNKPLDAMARDGSFLPELLGRISATVLRIPPLRERLAELPGIVRHLLDGVGGLEVQVSDQALRALQDYSWPGNLRELKNALEQGLMLSHGSSLAPEHFNWLKPSCRAKEPGPRLTMSELKERHISVALQQASGDASEVATGRGISPRQIAAVLQQSSGDVDEVATGPGISRATMYRRLKRLRVKNC